MTGNLRVAWNVLALAGLILRRKRTRVMGRKSEEFRAQARRLEERAETVIDEKVRLALLSVAGRWRGLARDAERHEMGATKPAAGPDRINRKAAVAAFGRAVRIYWQHETAMDLPEFLAKLAAAADDACSASQNSSEPNNVPEQASNGLTQVKDCKS